MRKHREQYSAPTLTHMRTEQKYKNDARPANHTRAPESTLFRALIGKNMSTTDHVILCQLRILETLGTLGFVICRKKLNNEQIARALVALT